MMKLSNILSNNSECDSCKSSKKRLVEAYGQVSVQNFIKKFEQEADDLGIEVTEADLRNYIKAFERLQDKLPSDQKDLGKWSLPKLIKFVTTGKPKEEEEEKEITPDVVYHNEDNSIIIYNGNSDKNCIRYGKGEKWCIASRSWAAHRYDESKGNPTFYLARNKNLPDSDDLSFIVIAIKSPSRYGEKHYVLHPRSNNPHYPEAITYEELLSQAPWLRDVPNLKSILKYQPLSAEEKISQKYKDSPTTYREWMKFPYKAKEQYLVLRKNARMESGKISKIFSDITNEEFIKDYLHKYPDILEFVVRTAGVVEPALLLKHLGNFSDSARKSITNNLHTPIKIAQLNSNYIPFDVKKLLVKLKKWELKPEQRIYVTKDGETIVLLELGSDFKMGLYQEDDEYPNVKINKRTSKFLLDYPDFDKIPISNLFSLAEKGAIDNEVIKKAIDDAKKDPKSDILVKKVGDEEVLIDPSSLTSYLVTNRGLTKVPFNDERVQAVLGNAEENAKFGKAVFKNTFSSDTSGIPASIDFDALYSLISALPYEDRVTNVSSPYSSNVQNGVAITGTDSSGKKVISFMEANPEQGKDFITPVTVFKKTGNFGGYVPSTNASSLTEDQFEPYFEYLRSKGITIDDSKIQGILNNSSVYSINKRQFLQKNPPLDPNNILKPVIDPDDDIIYLLNTRERKDSKQVSTTSDRLRNAPLSQKRYDRLFRLIQSGQPTQQEPTQQEPEQTPQQEPTQQEPEQPTQQEPVQQEPEQPAQQEPQQPIQQQPRQTATGNISVADRMRELGAGNQFTRIPASDFARLNSANGISIDPAGARGAQDRNRQLGNAGRVEEVIMVPARDGNNSGIYVIRLRNGSRVISIRIQGPSHNYLLIPGTAALALNSARDLMNALRQRNLAEIRRYLVKNYLDENPDHLKEVKELLRKHINEKNEQEAA